MMCFHAVRSNIFFCWFGCMNIIMIHQMNSMHTPPLLIKIIYFIYYYVIRNINFSYNSMRQIKIDTVGIRMWWKHLFGLYSLRYRSLATTIADDYHFLLLLLILSQSEQLCVSFDTTVATFPLLQVCARVFHCSAPSLVIPYDYDYYL